VLLYLGPTGVRCGIARGRRLGSGRRARAVAVAVGVTGASGAVVLAGGVSAAADVLGIAGIAALVGWLVRSHRAESNRRQRHEAVVGLCGALAAELHAGLPPPTALARAGADWPEFASVVRAARAGAQLPSALASLAEQPGLDGLRSVAAGWRVAERSGASLGAVLDRIADGLRDQSDARAEIESALAVPRATARMLAVLPIFGVLLGTAIGAAPMGFLVGTVAGRVCLLAGVMLALAGVAWVERLATTAGSR
jgi:tight adherence protein B